jgi:transposase
MGELRTRVRWSVADKRRIVELTFAPGASVARVAQAEGVNSHQVFQWRRSYRLGELVLPGSGTPSLLPVVVQQEGSDKIEVRSIVAEQAEDPKLPSGGSIHIEYPGRALISVEHSADIALLRVILESLRK